MSKPKQAIILAGGKGTRLRPYTTVLPKPLMPVFDKPILDIIIRQLKDNGFTKITIAVGYLAELIEVYFGNGSKFGVEITYSKEDKILGTAGPISLIENLEEDFLVMNGDILTNISFTEFFNYHTSNKSLITISKFKKDVPISLGVLKCEEDYIVDYIEKPTLHYDVSMGIYVLNKSVLQYLPQNEYCDFPDLILNLIQKKQKIIGYKFEGIWIDIGRKEDYDILTDEGEKYRNIILGS